MWPPFAAARARRTRCKAAFELIRDHGYVNFRTAAVTKHAGVSQGAHLHHFPTKDSLALATMQYAYEQTTAASLEFIAALRTDAEPVEAMLEDARRFFFSAHFRVALDILMAVRTDLQLRRHLGEEPALHVPGEGHLPFDPLLGGRRLLQALVLDLDRGRVRERREEAEVLLGEALPPEAGLEVDEADQLLPCQEGRGQAGGDPLEADRVGRPELRVGPRVDHQDPFAALRDRLDEGPRQAEVGGVDSLGELQRLGLEVPRLVPQHQEPAIRLEVREELLQDERREVRERDVGEQGEGDLVEDLERRGEPLQLGRVGQLTRGGAGQTGRGARGRDHRLLDRSPARLDDDLRRRRLLGDLDRRLAEDDPVPGPDGDGPRDPGPVQLSPVPGAEVGEDDPARPPGQARVRARQRPVGEEDVVRRGPAERQLRPVDAEAAGGLAGAVNRQDQHGNPV